MTRFSETQAFSGLAYGVMGMAGAVAAWAAVPWAVAATALTVNLLCLRTVVTDRELIVTFGALVLLYRRRVNLDEIESVQAVTYAPLADYGGWGIRGGGGSAALNARGNKGVRLALRGGRTLLIGSQKSEALAAALGPGQPRVETRG